MEIQSKQITEVGKQIIDGNEVFFQYSYDEKNPKLMNQVGFRIITDEPTQQALNGSISAGQINVQGFAKEEHFALIPAILKACLTIIEDVQKKASENKK